MLLSNNSLSERLPRDHLRRCSGRWYREGSRSSCPDRWVSSKCRYRAIQSNFFLIYSRVDQWLRLLDIDGGICPNRAGRIPSHRPSPVNHVIPVISAMVIEIRDPVASAIYILIAGSRIRSRCSNWSRHVPAEGVSAHNGMNMARCNTRAHKWI